MTFGAVRRGTLALAHSQVELHLVGKSRASDLELRTWIEQASRASERLYGPQMPSKVHIVIVAWPGQTELGSFGTVLRPLRPSALIYFGADATRFPLSDDWVATHEIFHVGNPLMRYKVPWFVEVLPHITKMSCERGLGALTAKKRGRICGMAFVATASRTGRRWKRKRQLAQDLSLHAGVLGRRVSGVFARCRDSQKSQGKRSLDDVMRSLRMQSLHATR